MMEYGAADARIRLLGIVLVVTLGLLVNLAA